METATNDVAKLYDKILDNEETRLANHPMEREITLLTIQHHLSRQDSSWSPKFIADIGGGPGKVAFALADNGNKVDLVDISPGLIGLAQKEQDRRVAMRNIHTLETISVGNALDDTDLKEALYDGVLLLGPLYHLLREDERILAVKNGLKLAKPHGGLVFCAFTSIAAHLRDLAVRDPMRLVKNREFYDKYLMDGRYERFNSALGIHVQGFHTQATAVREFFADNFANQVELIDLRSTEGILGGGLDSGLEKDGSETVQAWADLMFERYSTQEEFLGCADHLLAVIRKS